MTLQEFLPRLKSAKGSDNQYMARCPAHDDRQASLSVSTGKDGQILLNCHAGCSVENIVSALGLSMADLWQQHLPQTSANHRKIAAVYDYCDKNGRLLAQKIRYSPKSFSWRRPDGHGGWIPNRSGLTIPLYGLNRVKSDTIFLVEGEKDVDTLYALGLDAVSSPDGAGNGGKWQARYTESLRGLHIAVIPDHDETGRDFAKKVCKQLLGTAKSVKLLDLSRVWQEIPEKGDITDFVEAMRGENKDNQTICEILHALAEKSQVSAPAAPEKSTLPTCYSAQQLAEMAFPPTIYFVKKLLPEGTTLLTAASKVGKSWMAMDLGLSVSSGKPFLGQDTTKSAVLYLALEDSFARLKSRMQKVLQGEAPPENFYFMNCFPVLGDGFIENMDDFLTKHPEVKLVMIDTLQKIRGRAARHESAYGQDYRELGLVKNFFDQRGVSVLFLHHTRKMAAPDDPFDRISGTTGLMGAVDTSFIIEKDRDAAESTLHIVGRDVEQQEIFIRFDRNTCRWQHIGDAKQAAAERERQAYEANPLVCMVRALVDNAPEKCWEGSMQTLLDAGKLLTNHQILKDPKSLSYEVSRLHPDLLKFDGISHSSRTLHGKTIHKFSRAEGNPAAFHAGWEELTDSENPFISQEENG